jgi:hypothetical protein
MGVAAADALFGGLQGRAQREKGILQILPGRSQRKAPRSAVDKADGKPLFEASEALGQGSSGSPGRAGGGGDRSGFDDGEEEIVIGIEHC